MLVDLASLTVLPEQAAQHTLAAHPLDLGREAGLGGTLALTVASVTADTLGGVQAASALTRGAPDGLLNDLAILDELANIGTRVRVRNVGLLSRVKPNLALAHTKDGRSQTPLNSKIDHGCAVLVSVEQNTKNHTPSVACLVVRRKGQETAARGKGERKNSSAAAEPQTKALQAPPNMSRAELVMATCT